MSFVNKLITNEVTYEPYDGFCPDFSAYFNKLKFPDNYKELNPKPTPPIQGSSWYSPSYEYIVVWYDDKLIFHRKHTQANVKVKLVNLTRPTYGDIPKLSVLYITVPINVLHYFSIGSVWKNGKAIKQVQLNEYLITANQEVSEERDNVSYCPFYETKHQRRSTPFEPKLYTIDSDCNNYRYDQNQLIKIQQESTDFIVHPLQLFCSHYGMSADIKRILATYNWDKVRERFYLDENEVSLHSQKHVLLPKHFVKKDSIFLYHLKYDTTTSYKVKKLSQEILLSNQTYISIKIPFWHTQPVQLKIRGIELGDVVLCAEVIGINQPEGDDITLVLHRNKKADGEGSLPENGEKPIIKRYKREVKTESLANKIVDSEPDNRTVQDIKKLFENLGKQRIINQIKLESKNNNPPQIKTLLPKEANASGFGDYYGAEGTTGLAVCYLDDSAENTDIRPFRLWEMAKDFASLNRGTAHWFTPNLGYRDDDNLVFLSLEHDTAFAYPEIAFVIRIVLGNETFYIIDFSQKSHDISMSGIAYKESSNEDFITLNDIQSSKLAEILSEVILKEQLPTEYILEQNQYQTKISTFRHPAAQSSNWVYNAISKLTTRVLLK